MPPKQNSAAKLGSLGANGQVMTKFSFKCDLLGLNCTGLTFMVFKKKKKETFEHLKEYLKIGRFVKNLEFWLPFRMLSVPHDDELLNVKPDSPEKQSPALPPVS